MLDQQHTLQSINIHKQEDEAVVNVRKYGVRTSLIKYRCSIQTLQQCTFEHLCQILSALQFSTMARILVCMLEN